MILRISFICISILCAHLSFTQSRDSLSSGPLSKPTSSPKPYTTVITKNAKTSIGLFTVHKVDERYYFEIADSILGRDILVVSRLSKAAADMRARGSMVGYAGDELNENVLRFEKGVNNKIFVRNISYSERSADSTKPLYKAVTNSNLQPIVLAFDIKALHQEAGISATVIDLTDIINSDNDIFFFGQSKGAFKIGAYQPDKSYALEVKTFPINTEIKTVKTYTKGATGTILVGGAQNTVGPSGNFSVEINTSMVLLPKSPMQIRYADDRVGYFSERYTDFDADPQVVKEQSAINRWRLQPKPEDVEKYKRGELVEPQKQIVIYIDPATPAKWAPYLIEGINDWNKAFEKAGFKNAIVGKAAPSAEDNPSWSIDDARHSALVYKPSAIPNASGPRIVDPRSGEIIETHINWYHNIMKLVHDWYFIQTAAVDPRARKMEFDDNLMGELIRFVSSHEVGHTLGLLHNFGASAATPVEKLRDNNWLTLHGHTSSIMDYARFNYVAQPEDKIDETNLFPRIGDYDLWAIEFGYRWIPEATSPQAELPVLNKWIIEKQADRRYWFGNERNPNDPRSQSEDLGDNAMKAGEYGIKNLKRILLNLKSWTKVPDEGYENMTMMYNEVLSQYGRYTGHVLKNIGGRYETPKSVEQPGAVFEWVPAATQREAMAFLNRELFATPEWLLNEDVLLITGISPIDIIGKAQDNFLLRLFDPRVLGNLQAANAMNKNHYSLFNFFSDLETGIWTELHKRMPITIYRRNLQKAYVDKLIGLVNPPSTPLFPGGGRNTVASSYSSSDVVSVAKTTLAKLKEKIKVALPLIKDKMTQSHLKDVVQRITEALTVKTG